MEIVPLPDARFTLVDLADADWAKSRPWAYQRGYAGRRGMTLHRAIAMRAGWDIAGRVIAHQNGWKLDNRRENLWIAARWEVGRSAHRPNIHRFHDRWRAQFGQDVLGEFGTRDEAEIAYEAVARSRGLLTARAREKLLEPILGQLDKWVAAGVLVRRDGALIEDRYRLCEQSN